MDPTNANSSPAPEARLDSDEQLMLAFDHGSKEAFHEVFQRYKQPLFAFFRRRVANAALAEELTEETFLRILRAAARYEPGALFRTYLYAAGFKVLHAYRRKAAFRAAFLGRGRAANDVAVRDATDTGVVLRHALSRLERRDREILLLREYQELSYAETATLLDLPVNTVRSRLFRARAALRGLLASNCEKKSHLCET